MIKSAKKIIGSRVYDEETKVYLGRISDVAFSDSGKLRGYFMASDSIVPLDIWICPGAVRERRRGKMIVSRDRGEAEEDVRTFKRNVLKRNFVSGGRKIGRVRDMKFNEETGEITGFVYAENIFRRSGEINANKILIKGKNISIKE